MGCPKLHDGWRFVSAEYAYSPYGALAKSSGPDESACPFSLPLRIFCHRGKGAMDYLFVKINHPYGMLVKTFNK